MAASSARVLEWVDVATADGVERRPPRSSASRTGARTSGPGEVVSRASFQLAGGNAAEIKDTMAEMRGLAARGPALGHQDVRLDLQDPGDDPRAEGRTGGPVAGGRRMPRAPGRRRALLRRSTPTSSRTRVGPLRRTSLALMAEARRRVHERFGIELEPEVQVLRRGGVARRPGGWPTDAHGDARAGRGHGRDGANHPPVGSTAATAAGKRAPRRAQSRSRPALGLSRRGAPTAAPPGWPPVPRPRPWRLPRLAPLRRRGADRGPRRRRGRSHTSRGSALARRGRQRQGGGGPRAPTRGKIVERAHPRRPADDHACTSRRIASRAPSDDLSRRWRR